MTSSRPACCTWRSTGRRSPTPDDLKFASGTFTVNVLPERQKTFQACAFVAYQSNLPDDMENGFEDVTYYDAPEMATRSARTSASSTRAQGR